MKLKQDHQDIIKLAGDSFKLPDLQHPTSYLLFYQAEGYNSDVFLTTASSTSAVSLYKISVMETDKQRVKLMGTNIFEAFC